MPSSSYSNFTCVDKCDTGLSYYYEEEYLICY